MDHRRRRFRSDRIDPRDHMPGHNQRQGIDRRGFEYETGIDRTDSDKLFRNAQVQSLSILYLHGLRFLHRIYDGTGIVGLSDGQ